MPNQLFKKLTTARFGMGGFAVNTTRRAAKSGRVRPRPINVRLTSTERRTLSPEAQQELLIQRGAEQDQLLRLYEEEADFDKQVQTQLANRDGAFADPRLENVLDTQFRPTDSDAFIRNALLNARSFESEKDFFKSELFNDQDRNIGLFPKEPQQATITIQAFVAGQNPLVTTNEFVLSTVQEASQEKYQIFSTFDDDFIYFFDRNPHIYTYGGLLVNAAEIGPENPTPPLLSSREGVFEWKNRFQALYEKALRGSKCVESNARAILVYENVIREGFLLNFNLTEDARNPLSIPFSFTFYVTKESNNHRALPEDQQQRLPADFVGTATNTGPL